jgi:hypothetical protein
VTRRIIELADPDEPLAVRSVDFGRDGETLLVGRHSDDQSPRLGIFAIRDGQWATSYDWALQGAGVEARFCGKERWICFIDERRGAFSIDARSTVDGTTRLGDGVVHLAAAVEAAAVGLSGATVEILELPAARVLWNEPVQTPSALSQLTIAANGEVAAVARNATHIVSLFRTSDGNSLGHIPMPFEAVDRLAMDRRQRWIAAIGAGARGCLVWSADSGMPAGSIFCNIDQNNNTAQALHPTRDLIAYGTIAGYVVLIDLRNNAILYMEKLHDARIWDLSFSADGERLATAGDEGTIVVIELEEMLALGSTRMGTE